jgi:hypothetical protein
MPASKNINAYPIDLYMLVEGVLEKRKAATVECASEWERRAFRRQIYGLRNAIMETVDHPLREDAAKLCTRYGANNALVVCHVEDTPLPRGVSIALAKLQED